MEPWNDYAAKQPKPDPTIADVLKKLDRIIELLEKK
jgi:hypothetical protein